MQAEILLANPASKIRLLGVNPVGYETGNTAMTTGKTLPWLQDVVGELVWNSWAVGFRDVVILDTLNFKVTVYNLTANPLDVPANYDALKALLLSTAGE